MKVFFLGMIFILFLASFNKGIEKWEKKLVKRNVEWVENTPHYKIEFKAKIVEKIARFDTVIFIARYKEYLLTWVEGGMWHHEEFNYQYDSISNKDYLCDSCESRIDLIQLKRLQSFSNYSLRSVSRYFFYVDHNYDDTTSFIEPPWIHVSYLYQGIIHVADY